MPDKFTTGQAVASFNNVAYAYHDVDTGVETVIVDGDSRPFADCAKQILQGIAFRATGQPVGSPQNILDILLDQAYHRRRRTHLRTALINGSLRYKLNDLRDVKVSADGWEIVDHDVTEFIFRRSDVNCDQVTPVMPDHNLYDLMEHLPISDNHRILLMGAMVNAMFNHSHPIVNIVAEFGSGKTTLMSYIRDVVDPVPSDYQDVAPAKASDLKIALANSIMYTYDNKRDISDDISDLFAQVATNAVFRQRVLYTTSRMQSLHISSTIFIAGVTDVMRHTDILSRAIKIDLASLGSNANSDVLYIRDGIIAETLGAIFDIIQYVFARDFVDEYAPVRMSEYYWVTVAAAEYCGIDRAAVDSAFAENAVAVAEQAADASYVGRWLCANVLPGDTWEGNMTKMLDDMMMSPLSGERCPYNGPVGLGRKINELKKSIIPLGFDWKIDKRSKCHTILRRSVAAPKATSVETSVVYNAPPTGTDDDDVTRVRNAVMEIVAGNHSDAWARVQHISEKTRFSRSDVHRILTLNKCFVKNDDGDWTTSE